VFIGPSPVTSGWLFELVNMARSLDGPPEAESLLTMPKGFNFMNLDSLGPNLFIRLCYPPINRNMFEELLPRGIKRVILFGIPGIGKTCFLYYLLCDLIRQRKTVVFEDFTGLMFMVNADGVIFEGKRGDAIFKEPLNNENAYYLFNCGGKAGLIIPSVVPAVSIVASSPNEDHTRDFIKAGAGGLFYLPMWELTELETCRQKCDLKLAAGLISERFLLWGGVARRCFFTGEEALLKAQMNQALATYEKEPHSILDKVGGQDSLKLSHRLLHFNVSDTYKNFTMMLASDKVADLMCELNLLGVVDRIAMLQTDREEHGLRGKLFERFAHCVLPLGSSKEYPMYMVPASGGNRKAFPTPCTPKPEPITSMKEVREKPNNTYLLPTVSNFRLVDSLLKPRTAIQITVSPTRTISNSSLTDLVNQLGCTKDFKLDLVWVVPPDIAFHCPKLPAELEDRVSQWVLRLTLEVPPALKKIRSATDRAFPIAAQESNNNNRSSKKRQAKKVGKS